MPRAVSVTLLLTLLGGTVTAAQTCKGFDSFQRRPVQLLANGVLARDSKAYGAGVAVGGTGLFGHVEAGAIDVPEYSGAASFSLSGGVGYQAPLNESGTVQLCPTLGVSVLNGPHNVNGTGNDFKETDWWYGVTLGGLATRLARRFQVVPTASLVFGNAHTTLSGASGSVSNSQTLGLLGLGAGFVFGHEVTVTPLVSFPITSSGNSATFSMTLGLTFGGHQPPLIVNPATSCAGQANSDPTVYDTLQIAERPRLRTAPEKDYPALQRDQFIEGRVLVELVVRADGTPDQSSVQVVQSRDAGLDAAAVKWIRRASFWPACRNGQPVTARFAQPVDFCVVGCARGVP